jgi:putative inorganic carbon (hco3(-)) transporter
MSFAIYLLVLAITYLRPVEAFAPELEIYKTTLWLSIISLLASIASFAFNAATSDGRQNQAKRHAVFLVFLFCMAISLSLATKGLVGDALNALSLFSPSAVVFLLTVINVNTISRLKVSCFTIALCTVLLAVASIASFHTGFMREQLVIAQVDDSSDDADESQGQISDIPAQDTSGRVLWRVRSLGFLNDPNDFGQAMVMALPFLFGGYVAKKRLRNLLLVAVPAAILLYTIYLTHSRGAILGIAALFFFMIKQRFGTPKTVLMVGVLIALSTVVSGLAGGREFSSDDDSAGDRIDAWGEGIAMLMMYPIFGVGFRNFIDYNFITAHNSWVLCFSELGLLGYFFWIGILVVAFVSLNQTLARAPRGSEQTKWAALLRASLLGFLTCAFFLSRTYIPNLFILLALCICAAQCINIELSRADGQPPPETLWIKRSAIISISSIIGIYIIVRLHNAGLV